ncbi:MAG: hydroxyacid dehydrogenase [Clostridia bacterium]|nr:hydroxyacid dehydrogenase [Clostridia bacterium]
MKSFVALPSGYVRDTFFTKENIALAESLGRTVFFDGTEKCTADDVVASIGDSEVYITGWGSPKLDARILDAAPSLRLHVHLCGTVVPYDDPEVWRRGVRVVSGNYFFAESVAEGTIGYMLTALRDIPLYSGRLKNEKLWKKTKDMSYSLLGKTVGIVSYGTISRHLVRMLQPFRVRIKVYDIVPLPEADRMKYGLEQASLEEIFSTCDIITVHTPLFDATRHLIGKPLFELIKQDALFVNTSRGEILDQDALEDALETGRFRAVLDVYRKEPPPPEERLYSLPNVIMMPHMAGPTVDLRQYITHELLLEASGFIDRGEPLLREITAAAAEHMSRH